MAIKTLAETVLVDPPEGTVAIAVARHLSPAYEPDEVNALHRRRSEMIHAMVDEFSLDVRDWGATDAEHPSEIVAVLIELAPTVIPAIASVMAAWIRRPAREPADNKGFLGIKLKRPDGCELEVSYRAKPDKAAQLIEGFMRSES